MTGLSKPYFASKDFCAASEIAFSAVNGPPGINRIAKNVTVITTHTVKMANPTLFNMYINVFELISSHLFSYFATKLYTSIQFFASIFTDLSIHFGKLLIEKINSTPLWILILQIHESPTVEFNPSDFSAIIFSTNMVASSRQEGFLYEQSKTFNP